MRNIRIVSSSALTSASSTFFVTMPLPLRYKMRLAMPQEMEQSETSNRDILLGFTGDAGKRLRWEVSGMRSAQWCVECNVSRLRVAHRHARRSAPFAVRSRRRPFRYPEHRHKVSSVARKAIVDMEPGSGLTRNDDRKAMLSGINLAESQTGKRSLCRNGWKTF